MSSKQQFREALKGDKKIIADLKKELEIKEQLFQIVNRERLNLKNKVFELHHYIDSKLRKKWYQFWKY